MSVKITKRNISPTASQMVAYKNNKTIQRAHVPNLRFGKILLLSDQDLDG